MYVYIIFYLFFLRPECLMASYMPVLLSNTLTHKHTYKRTVQFVLISTNYSVKK